MAPTDPDSALAMELVQGVSGDAAVIVETAKAAAGPSTEDVLNHSDLRLVREQLGDGNVVRVLDLEPFTDAPRRRKGHVKIDEAASFVAYVNEQKDSGSRIYASRAHGQIVAVLNDDFGGGREEVAGWRDHRATLALERTPEWKRWLALDGKLDSQVIFAEHLEVCLADIVEPLAADLVEIARSFTASTSIQFRSARNLSSGETQIAYDEEITAAAGSKKNITIPSEFKLRIAPYHGIERLDITARLRYRLSNGTLAIGYVLDKPTDVELQAFGDVVALVGEQTELQPLMGVPASERA